jgi:TDG/mug DNA glycosylase family protein
MYAIAVAYARGRPHYKVGMSGDVLPDVMTPGLRVVFCGTAAGDASARARAYYAGPGNRFWSTLHLVGLTPDLIVPSEFALAVRWGIGFTDLCKIDHGMDHQIASSSYDVRRLEQAMRRYAPRVLAFTSKRSAAIAFGVKQTTAISLGLQDARIGEVPTWVLPSPSGAARGHWSLEPWSDLAAYVRDSAVCSRDR